MIVINGAAGEGGGQILRTALALSLVTQQPFRIEAIRAGRKKPGLLRQHLTAVQAAVAISNGEVSGASIGSQELRFTPGDVKPGAYTFRIGTAGSTTLVLQTILPALVLATGPSQLTLEGGTHNPFAPPFDFLVRAFLPVLNRMGPSVAATLDRPGFYPAGGGQLQVVIEPCAALQSLDLRSRGAVQAHCARALVANLPSRIAKRELAVIAREMSWPPECLQIEVVPHSAGPGNVVTVEIASENVTDVFTGFGQRGVLAETVASRVAQAVQQYLAVDVSAGPYLADQLLLPFALAGAGGFTTLPLSMHTTTNIDVIQQFLDIDMETTQLGPQKWCVQVGSGGLERGRD